MQGIYYGKLVKLKKKYIPKICLMPVKQQVIIYDNIVKPRIFTEVPRVSNKFVVQSNFYKLDSTLYDRNKIIQLNDGSFIEKQYIPTKSKMKEFIVDKDDYQLYRIRTEYQDAYFDPIDIWIEDGKIYIKEFDIIVNCEKIHIHSFECTLDDYDTVYITYYGLVIINNISEPDKYKRTIMSSCFDNRRIYWLIIKEGNKLAINSCL